MPKLSEFKNPQQRLEFLENKLKIKLTNLKKVYVDDEKSTHCENLIGGVSLPVGVAGPLKLRGKYVEGEYYVPLATTEGALVASVNRGCKVISLSGGTSVYTHRVGTTRGPVFYTESLEKSKNFYRWVKENEIRLGKIGEETSSHLKFQKLDIRMLANYVFVRFYFDTQDAMGMNMVTIATQNMVEFIEKETGIKCLSLAGNFDIDKKPAWLNFINNRGFKAWAEVTIIEKIVKDILKTTPEKIFDLWLAKCMIGSAMSGSLGFNAHFANVVAAFFAATGQDLAHVVEGSLGITTTKVLSDGSLYASVYLPAVMLGTVGGGTGLKTQTEVKSIIGVKKSVEFTEILAGVVLAGEISLLASLAEGSLAKAHQKLGR
ncbi:hydroxymethylglutaryl-CoA reductase [Candidatus Roizmanbacteria bacterium]|nr:hydroxymethylglutaryl-CoA reductase [Candidatus Roizmanbacteria bacterium]